MKRAFLLIIILLVYSTQIFSQNSIRYKFQIRIPALGIEVLEESTFLEGGSFQIPDVSFNHPPFNELYAAVKNGYFSLDNNSIQNDIYMEITLEGLNPLTGGLYEVFGEPLFLNFKIDVWNLPDNYSGPYPPNFDPTSPFYFNPSTGLEFRVNKTDAFYAFLDQIGIDATEDLGFAFIQATNFSGNDITSIDEADYVSFKTNHLSKFGGGKGHIHDVVIENQTIILSPPKGYFSNNTPKLKLFFSPSDSLILEWDRFITEPNTRFIFGSSSGVYDLGEFNVTGQRAAFIPGGTPHNLSTGRYYGLITNSIHNTFDQIEEDYNNDPAGIDFSNEIQFIIEAQNAPVPLSPRGEINDATPIFQWDAIPGVPAYWLIVSSTPFTVVSLPNGDVSVQGANILWNYITDQTTVQYGERNSNSPYNEDAQPLLNGNEYNYTILNLYDNTDISFASTVFSGAFAFTFQTEQQLDQPQLVQPVDNTDFISAEEIIFKWDPVPNANNYTLYLYQRVQSFAGNEQQIDLPIWNNTTTNTSITFPAITALTKGSYVWNIMATDISGTGALSETFLFNYDIEMGSFRVQAINTETGENLLGFNVEANAVSGGVSPSNPFIVTNSTSYTDSLVVGDYEFVGSKTGFHDTTITANINSSSLTNIVLHLRPYPSIITGEVRDNADNPVSSATVKLTNLLTLDVTSVTSGAGGDFSATVPKGTYSIKATKPGYLSSTPINISPDDNQFTLTSPLVITLDNANISGQVINDEGQPVQLATVLAIQGDDVRQKTTNAAGAFSFNLNSGTWKIEVSKSGFISPDPEIYNLAVGDNLQNQMFTLIPRANQVTGFVYKVIGGSGTTPFENITVTATPDAGTPQTSETNSSGSYSLSLKGGSYTISVDKNGYSSSEPVHLTLNVAESIADINFVLTPNPSTVKGTVTSLDGTALGGVTISNGISSVQTLPNGSYSLSTSSGSMTITAEKTSFISPDPQNISVSPGQTLTGIDFVMIPNAGVISGKVTSFSQPLSNALVSAVSSEQILTTTTDADGNYSFSVKPGSWSLTASKSGFVNSTPSQVVIGPGQQSINNDFNLVQNTALISGTVSGSSGAISNAIITIAEIDDPANSINSVTNINGNFALSVSAGKAYNVSISKTGYGDFSSTTDVLSPQSTTTFNVTLSPNPSSVSGKVFNNLQEALAGATVRLIKTSTGQLIDEKTTQFDGTFSFGLPAGNYTIEASKAGHISNSINISLDVGTNLTNIIFNLTENFAVITGSVKDVLDNPIGSVTINATGDAGGATVTSDENGNFIISRLLGGTYQIKFSKDGFSDSTITNFVIEDGQSKILNMNLLLLNGRVFGTITDNNGNAVEGATVNLIGNSTFNALSDAEGKFDITSVSYGSYQLSAIKSGFTQTGTTEITITQNSPEIQTNYNALVQNNSIIQGVVKDDAGNPVGGAVITIQGNLGAGNAETNNSGNYIITSLAAGNYTVSASKENYSSASSNVSVDGTLQVDLTLVKNKAKITGKVTDQLGGSLVFLPAVIAISSLGDTYNTIANTSGEFEFDEVADNLDYTIFTNIYREGYINDTTAVSIPLGTTSVGPVELTVTINNSLINGNTGIGDATITFLDKATNQSKLLTTTSSGNYEIKFIPVGDYKITPSKLGYTFSPSSKDVTVGISDSTTIDFSATSNTGNIIITAKESDNTPVSQVNISVISNDTTKIFNSTTNAEGIAEFNNIPADSYIISASKDGYTSNPPNTTKTLTANQTINVDFLMSKNSANLSGKVLRRDNGPIDGANVKLIYKSSGQTVFTTSENGNYTFESLQSGDALLVADKVGFIADTLNITLNPGVNLTDQNLTLTPNVINISGRVLFRNEGVEGVNITVSSTNIFNEETDANGNFLFVDMPVKTGTTDTTIYDVRINDPDYLSIGEIVQVTGNQLGQTIQLNDFLLPSGEIVLTFSDGVDVLPGVLINFTKPNGTTISTTTGSKGRFKSGMDLKKGTYQISANKENYLTPDNSYLTVALDTDTSIVNRTILMPFNIIPIDSMTADESALLVIKYKTDQSNSSGTLYYKKASASNYTTEVLQNTGSSFEATIPAQFSLEEINYYVSIYNATDSVNYRSDVYTITPIAKGILTNLSVSPEMDKSILRVNDGYPVSISIRDGLNNDMTNKFTGTVHDGSLTWSSDNVSAFEFTYPDTQDSTQLIITPKALGDYKLKLTAKLNGSVLTKSFSFTVSDIPLKLITVTSPVQRLSNRSLGIQFNYSATDTLDRAVLLGNSTTWSVTPANAGAISNAGFFTPFDTTFIGNPVVSIYDEISGAEGKKQIAVYATVPPNINYIVTDGSGMSLKILPGTLSFPIELFLSKAQNGPSKKIFTPLGSDKSFTVSSQLYNIQYSSSIALPGDSLSTSAELSLPVEDNLKLYKGQKSIGRYEPIDKNWLQLNISNSAQTFVTTNDFRKFGEYAVLTENEALGLKYVSVLPSPFSPSVAPLKIGYFLTSIDRFASVTIKIYNIRGELVKTILENDLQTPGRYGSKSSNKEITWDGSTNSGRQARNGRYIIKIDANDSSGNTSEILQVILIK